MRNLRSYTYQVDIVQGQTKVPMTFTAVAVPGTSKTYQLMAEDGTEVAHIHHNGRYWQSERTVSETLRGLVTMMARAHHGPKFPSTWG